MVDDADENTKPRLREFETCCSELRQLAALLRDCLTDAAGQDDFNAWMEEKPWLFSPKKAPFEILLQLGNILVRLEEREGASPPTPLADLPIEIQDIEIMERFCKWWRKDDERKRSSRDVVDTGGNHHVDDDDAMM